MIQAVIRIQGIGLLHDPSSAISLARVTCLYAENGRGKSTLAAIASSLRTGDPLPLLARKTLGGRNEPEVALRIDGGNVEFNGGAWTRSAPDICVFDTDFVNANVYSGSEVSADHRRQLLDFVLGEDGLRLKQAVDDLTAEISAITSRIREQGLRLGGIARPLALEQYLGIQPEPAIQVLIKEARRSVVVAEGATAVASKQGLTELSLPTFDVERFSALLSESLPSIREDAREKVRSHVEGHGGAASESWIREGLSLVRDNTCPFCGQTLAPALQLLDAYDSYFDERYDKLVEELASFRRFLSDMFGDAALVVLRLDLERNDLAAESWEPLGPLPLVSSPIPTIEANAHEARALLEGLLDRKVANPLDTIPDLGDVARAIELLRKNAELAASYNDDVRNANSAIEAIRVGAASSELTAAAERVEQLERQRSRYESPNKDECDAYQSLVSQKQGLEAAKVEARRQLDVFTADLLGKYQKSINDCLTLFDAGFRIVDATTSYEGGLPRLQYALELRSHRIAIGSREGSASRPRFGNTLSDSDRRALAFAFFTARLQVDGNLSRQTVVFDDPISSFDQFRRRTTADVLMDIAKSSQQIIVMSHDPLFIQALSEDRRAQTLGVAVLELRRSQDGYTSLDECDIEERVQSAYKANYDALVRYVEQGDVVDRQQVVRAIRPMLEANLRYRYQGALKGAYCLGKMIEAIRTSVPASPLIGAKPLLPALERIDAYATDFTHDAEGAVSLDQLDDGQLQVFAKQALAIARGGGVSP